MLAIYTSTDARKPLHYIGALKDPCTASDFAQLAIDLVRSGAISVHLVAEMGGSASDEVLFSHYAADVEAFVCL